MEHGLNQQQHGDSTVDPILQQMKKWLPDWTQQSAAMFDEIQSSQILDPKLVLLIGLIIDVTATHLYAPGVRRQVRACLKVGICHAEILEVFKLASVVGIHSCALGVPILKAEMAELGIAEPMAAKVETPVCDQLKANGQFNPLWETLYQWDPAYLESFLSMATEVWRNNILPLLWIELLCIAGDAALTHLWAPGVKRHIHAALHVGATHAQILAVLKLVSLQGIQACELGSLILDEIVNESSEA